MLTVRKSRQKNVFAHVFQLNISNPKDTNETAEEYDWENTVTKFKFMTSY